MPAFAALRRRGIAPCVWRGYTRAHGGEIPARMAAIRPCAARTTGEYPRAWRRCARAQHARQGNTRAHGGDTPVLSTHDGGIPVRIAAMRPCSARTAGKYPCSWRGYARAQRARQGNTRAHGGDTPVRSTHDRGIPVLSARRNARSRSRSPGFPWGPCPCAGSNPRLPSAALPPRARSNAF